MKYVKKMNEMEHNWCGTMEELEEIEKMKADGATPEEIEEYKKQKYTNTPEQIDLINQQLGKYFGK